MKNNIFYIFKKDKNYPYKRFFFVLFFRNENKTFLIFFAVEQMLIFLYFDANSPVTWQKLAKEARRQHQMQMNTINTNNLMLFHFRCCLLYSEQSWYCFGLSPGVKIPEVKPFQTQCFNLTVWPHIASFIPERNGLYSLKILTHSLKCFLTEVPHAFILLFFCTIISSISMTSFIMG